MPTPSLHSRILTIACVLGLGALGALGAACDRTPKEPAPSSAKPTAGASGNGAGSPAGEPRAPQTRRFARPAAERVVAIGDLHGDLDAARRALRLAGAVDDKDAWIGGKLVVVQTGDEVDRGDGDRAILDLFANLAKSAKATGGDVIAMLGNHEIMNVQGDFRYVTRGGYAAFSDVEPRDTTVAARVARLDERARHRGAAFTPGGVYATMLADRPVIAAVGDTVFVHGGVLPKHVAAGIDAINDDVRAWLLGRAHDPPAALQGDDGPLWTRLYSGTEHPSEQACATLGKALDGLGVKRMVVGHTVQEHGITSACDGRAWRIDVGMTHVFGGPVQVLELRGDAVKVLR
jgi:hypothetical protein